MQAPHSPHGGVLSPRRPAPRPGLAAFAALSLVALAPAGSLAAPPEVADGAEVADSAEADPSEAEADPSEAEAVPSEAEPSEADPDPAAPDATNEPAAPAERPPPTVDPPRVAGPYVGLTAALPLTFARVRSLDTDGIFLGPGGGLRGGEAVFPWMTVGIELTGSLGYRPSQRVGQGAFLVDFGFLPRPQLPLSLHLGFGVGGGAVRQDGIEGREGFGGAAFKAALRYEFFPRAALYRPRRSGGLGLGPEIGWLGFTPATAGRPMSNTLYLGLATTFYFGD